MITANEALQQLEPKTLTDEAIDALLDGAARRALAEKRREFCVDVPRHSIDRAAVLAECSGWVTTVSRVRDGGDDAPDCLSCKLPSRSRMPVRGR